ncbi:hypothetical protein TrST_g13128 [Triparma strigata]|uniref:C2H2-type domain-containing protein n=1 Tax=Triparma strigata TaxID=1606541 RepID=A0A9W7C431_9STRA|nr:hypothetical protein TrST_g13128 [Triparma strigata]
MEQLAKTCLPNVSSESGMVIDFSFKQYGSQTTACPEGIKSDALNALGDLYNDVVVRGEDVEEVEKEVVVGVKRKAEEENGCSHTQKPVVKMHFCDELNCTYKTKRAGDLNKHMKFVHSINVKLFHCPFPGCTYTAKQASNLTSHTQNIHSLNVQWHRCTFPHCTFKAKQTGFLRRHRQLIHDLDVKWHYCREAGCGYKAKLKYHLTLHIKRRHGGENRTPKHSRDKR